jgi:hypothetical protein
VRIITRRHLSTVTSTLWRIMTKIILPNNWTPRPYQREAWDALTRRHDPIKRALLVWHRRAGKDDVCLHLAACKAMQRTGNYWHMLPEYGQARKSVWDAVNPHSGMRPLIFESLLNWKWAMQLILRQY